MAPEVEPKTLPVDLKPVSGERSLEIGVIGAGIAGLGAAIALGQAGHRVEVCTRKLGSIELVVLHNDSLKRC